MKNLKAIIVSLTTVIVLTSCSNNNCITGEGSYSSKEYNLSPFSGVSVAGDADVFITKDSIQSVRIEAQGNVLNALNVAVRGNKLVIGEDNCFRKISRMKVYISTPTFNEMIASGSIHVYSPDLFSSNVFKAVLSGTGEMNLNLNVQELHASISGSGDIVANGTAVKQYLSSSGDGYFGCFGLIGDHVDIDVSGSATAEVHATQTLNIDVSGTAFIYYKGHPQITQKISGTATIVDAN